MNIFDTIKAVQAKLGFTGDDVDGKAGPQTWGAIVAALAPELATAWQTVFASSFADPADLDAFRRCKATGKTDKQCFAVGDNGEGRWDHFTAQERIPMAAIPSDVWAAAGKTGGAPIEVRYAGKIVFGILGDTLPPTNEIHNGAGIDLNPAFAKAFGVKPPFMIAVEWRWVGHGGQS
ncbi:MAG TPA: hypothetical protein VK474_08985 [Chthoniobacterales bacterium]|nr:hypothetical protein [Chthoniobacterales bacterium]